MKSNKNGSGVFASQFVCNADVTKMGNKTSASKQQSSESTKGYIIIFTWTHMKSLSNYHSHYLGIKVTEIIGSRHGFLIKFIILHGNHHKQ